MPAPETLGRTSVTCACGQALPARAGCARLQSASELAYSLPVPLTWHRLHVAGQFQLHPLT